MTRVILPNRPLSSLNYIDNTPNHYHPNMIYGERSDHINVNESPIDNINIGYNLAGIRSNDTISTANIINTSVKIIIVLLENEFMTGRRVRIIRAKKLQKELN